jgi:hypothetical protein
VRTLGVRTPSSSGAGSPAGVSGKTRWLMTLSRTASALADRRGLDVVERNRRLPDIGWLVEDEKVRPVNLDGRPGLLRRTPARITSFARPELAVLIGPSGTHAIGCGRRLLFERQLFGCHRRRGGRGVTHVNLGSERPTGGPSSAEGRNPRLAQLLEVGGRGAGAEPATGALCRQAASWPAVPSRHGRH